MLFGWMQVRLVFVAEIWAFGVAKSPVTFAAAEAVQPFAPVAVTE